MKKLKILAILLPFLIGMSFLSSCNKTTIDDEKGTLDLNISHILFNNLKDSNEDTVPECQDESLDYIKFKVDGEYKYADIFELPNGELHSTVEKVDVGNHTISEFYIYHNNMPPSYGPEDDLILASPIEGSEYGNLVEYPLNIDFTIEAFKKTGLDVSVLCYDSAYYVPFGFYWFNIHIDTIHPMCWFGDVCTSKLEDFEGSPYENQENGIQFDMPAIFKIDVYDNGDLVGSFNNLDWLGEGNCLQVYWPNDPNETDHIKFKLYVYLPKDNGFDWVLYDTFEFDDMNSPDPGPDGVFDFVVGECQAEEADAVYLAWLNLPDTLSFKIGSQYNLGTHGGYVDLILSGFNDYYDIPLDTVAGYCVNNTETILVNHLYPNTAVFSIKTLLTSNPFGFSQEQIKKLIYLGLYVENTNGGIIQEVMWKITNNTPLSSPEAITIYNDVEANYQNFLLYPGGLEPVFIHYPGIQPFIFFVDP